MRDKMMWCMLAVAVAARAAFYLGTPGELFVRSAYVSDSGAYFVKPALFYLKTGSFPDHMVHPFGFPLLIAESIKMMGSERAGLEGIVVLQIICSAIMCWMVFRLTSDLMGRACGLLAAALFAIEPSYVMFPSMIFADIFMNCCLFIGVYYLFKVISQEDNGGRHVIGSIVFITLAIYLRPVALYMPLIVFIAVALNKGVKKRSHVGRRLLIMGVGCLICVQPWYLRNYARYGKYEMSGIQNIMLLHYSLEIERGAGCSDEAHFRGDDHDNVNGALILIKTVARHPWVAAKKTITQTVYKMFEPGSSVFARSVERSGGSKFGRQFEGEKFSEDEFIDIGNRYRVDEIARTWFHSKTVIEVVFAVCNVMFLALLYWGCVWGYLALWKGEDERLGRDVLLAWGIIMVYLLIVVSPLAGGMRYRMSFVLLAIPLASFYWYERIVCGCRRMEIWREGEVSLMNVDVKR